MFFSLINLVNISSLLYTNGMLVIPTILGFLSLLKLWVFEGVAGGVNNFSFELEFKLPVSYAGRYLVTSL